MPENKLDDEKVLRMFVDKLIADKGGDTLDAKQKETLQGELFEELDSRVQKAMIRALPDEKLVELDKLLDADASDEEIGAIFGNSGVDFGPAVRKVMSDFRNDYFTGKIEVSVKTEAAPAEEPGAETSQVEVKPVAQPTQGTISAVPGKSDVEGVATPAQARAGQPEVIAQGAVTQLAQERVDAPGQQPGVGSVAQPAQTAQVVQAQQMPGVQPGVSNPAQSDVVNVAQPGVAEQPLQAAPDLMTALNNATANLNAAVAGMGGGTAGANVPGAVGAASGAGMSAGGAGAMPNINTTEKTGEEA